jgi:hypothetical protein
VKNYLSWCSVSVAGHAASTDAAQTVCVAAGAVTLTATPASATFEIGTAPWHGTAGDTGSGDPGTISGMMSTIMVTASGASKCVWACCPFTSGTGCSGLPNQCP